MCFLVVFSENRKRPSPLIPTDYRPISNLSILDKTYQRVIAQYIISYSIDIWINNKQYGFLPKRSTMDAITQVIDDWSDAKDKHKEIGRLGWAGSTPSIKNFWRRYVQVYPNIQIETCDGHVVDLETWDLEQHYKYFSI
jgi:hypothetical protein